MRTSKYCRVGVMLVGAAALVAGGCGSDSQVSRIRSNPTPELDTLSQRPDDIDNRIAITNDTNLRMFNYDLGRFFLLDRPSRLSNYSPPY